MDDFNKVVSYSFSKNLNKKEILNLQAILEAVDGIKSSGISSDSVRVEYNSLLVSKEYITEMFRDFGFQVKEKEKKKAGIFSRFIDKLIRSNKESFGGKKLDCCDLKQKK